MLPLTPSHSNRGDVIDLVAVEAQDHVRVNILSLVFVVPNDIVQASIRIDSTDKIYAAINIPQTRIYYLNRLILNLATLFMRDLIVPFQVEILH